MPDFVSLPVGSDCCGLLHLRDRNPSNSKISNMVKGAGHFLPRDWVPTFSANARNYESFVCAMPVIDASNYG
jgi:hypothetical protein